MGLLPQPLQGLEDYPQFVHWTTQERGGKLTKIPVDPATLLPLDLTDPRSWKTSEEAVRLSHETNLAIGFVFTPHDPFFFVDVDNCVDANGRTNFSQEVLGCFPGAAVEVSQSGRGLHIFGRGLLESHRNRIQALGLELYTKDRFVALTCSQTSGEINTNQQANLENFYGRYFPATSGQSSAEWTTGPVPEWSGPKDDGKLIEKMLKVRGAQEAFGTKASVIDLWNADAERLSKFYPDESGGYDSSSADSALCSHLAFWTGKDCDRIDRLFRLSKLNREKWEEREDYRERTILGILSLSSTVYNADKFKEEAKEKLKKDAEAAGGRVGLQYMSIEGQVAHFNGCTYISSEHKILTPKGLTLKPDRFRVMFGGYVFAMDSEENKTTNSAFEVFTESRAYHFPKADMLAFQPERTPLEVFEDEGILKVNQYVPIAPNRKKGDPARFLKHLGKLFPVKTDRDILLAFMAAVVQYPGIKFQWAPIVQSEITGSGKTVLMECLRKAVGMRYSHMMKGADLEGNLKFTGWLQGKLFIGIEELFTNDRANTQEALKDLITNSATQIQFKGGDQYTGDNRANFFICTNHKNAVILTDKERRYAMFYSAIQTLGDLAANGMGGSYFPTLWDWLRGDGFEIVTDFLLDYEIPDALNPAKESHRAPETSSTLEALKVSRGKVEQHILEATKNGKVGFKGGWISSSHLTELIDSQRWGSLAPPNKRKEILANIGYISVGRSNNGILIDKGQMSVLYVKASSIQATQWAGQSRAAKPVVDAYVEAQQNQPEKGGAAASIFNIKNK